MSNISFDLTGKVALVTGATHGIGMAIAKGLARQGARLCVNGHDDGRLEACKEEYAKDGIDVFAVNFDVTSEEEVDRGIRRIEEEVGDVDILVNNAGSSSGCRCWRCRLRNSGRFWMWIWSRR